MKSVLEARKEHNLSRDKVQTLKVLEEKCNELREWEREVYEDLNDLNDPTTKIDKNSNLQAEKESVYRTLLDILRHSWAIHSSLSCHGENFYTETTKKLIKKREELCVTNTLKIILIYQRGYDISSITQHVRQRESEALVKEWKKEFTTLVEVNNKVDQLLKNLDTLAAVNIESLTTEQLSEPIEVVKQDEVSEEKEPAPLNTQPKIIPRKTYADSLREPLIPSTPHRRNNFNHNKDKPCCNAL